MEKNVLLILVGKREEDAVLVQKILTKHAEHIKTRLGIHDGVLGDSNDRGLIFCELAGDSSSLAPIVSELNCIDGIHAELVSLNVD